MPAVSGGPKAERAGGEKGGRGFAFNGAKKPRGAKGAEYCGKTPKIPSLR